MAVIGGTVVPLPTPSQMAGPPQVGFPNLSPVAQQQQPPQVYPQSQNPAQMFASNSLNQKGAFIPLQVARKSTTPSSPNNLNTNTETADAVVTQNVI